MLEANIETLAITDKGFALILKAEGEEKAVPIFVGTLEAQSISMVLLGLTRPRPITHDLMTSMLNKFNVHVKRVIIDDIKNETFYAKIVFEQDGDTVRLDARPSDAIAVALRMSADIFIEEKVMAEAGINMDNIQIDDKEGKYIFKEENEVEYNAGYGGRPLKEEYESNQAALNSIDTFSDGEIMSQASLDDLYLRLEEALKDERYEEAAKLRDMIESMKDE